MKLHYTTGNERLVLFVADDTYRADDYEAVTNVIFVFAREIKRHLDQVNVAIICDNSVRETLSCSGLIPNSISYFKEIKAVGCSYSGVLRIEGTLPSISEVVSISFKC